MMIMKLAPVFQGITRYSGEQYKMENHVIQNFENADRVYIPGIFSDKAVVLTDKDMFQFMKDTYNIVFPESCQNLTSARAMEEALNQATNSAETDALSKVKGLIGEVANKMFDTKIFAYADARQAAGSDIDGQPIVNITI
jgi:hypothetical protein